MMIVWFQCRCGLDQPIPKLARWVRVYLGDEVMDWCRGCGNEYLARITKVYDDAGQLFTSPGHVHQLPLALGPGIGQAQPCDSVGRRGNGARPARPTARGGIGLEGFGRLISPLF